MKRNHPPDNSEELHDEQDIIDSRLSEQFSWPTRLIPITNKGYWIDDHRHVKVESSKGIANEYLSYSSTLKYYFLNPFEALFCLETSQVMIFFNGLPLSLAEAYHILLDNSIDFKHYRIFQQLNRGGYICLKPDNIQAPVEEKSLTSCSTRVISDISHEKDSLGDVIFDVYKRETFVKNKPRKGELGNPDYKIIIHDKSSDRPPNVKQLENARDSHKLTFAVVDDDGSICFNQFKYIGSEELVINLDRKTQ